MGKCYNLQPWASPQWETARHYGNTRCAMFAVLTAIVGGLIPFALDQDRAPLLETPKLSYDARQK